MKKVLSLLLAFSLAFSCFGVMSFAADEDDFRPDCVAAVIDPIISDVASSFCESINQVGYESVDKAFSTGYIENMEGFIAANSDDSMFGVSLGDLYGYKDTPFAWSNFRVCMVGTDKHTDSACEFKKAYDECAEVLLGNIVEYPEKARDLALFEKIAEVKITVGENKGHYNYYFTLGKGELSLVRANTNLYLKRIISNYWGGGKFYTNENIVKIANFIGTLINPQFTLLPKGYRPIDDNVSFDDYTFFGKIVELSGLDQLINSNWCRQPGMDFISLMGALGVHTESLLTGEKEDGFFVARRLLTDMFSEFFSAPVTYVLNVLWAFSKEYSTTYQPAFRALFTMRSAQVGDQYTEEALGTLTGVLNFLSDAIDSVNNKVNGNRRYDNIAFSELPVSRFAKALDQDELFLMLLCYLDINRAYKAPAKRYDTNKDGVIDESTEVFRRVENEIAIENMWVSFETAAKNTLTADELSTVKSFYGDFIQGEMTMTSFLYDMLTDVTDTNVGQIGNDFMNSIKTSVSNLLKKILNAIDNFVRILLGEKDIFERI